MFSSIERETRVPAWRPATITLLAFVTLIAGCGYSIRPPYENRIRTVYVPVFKSVSFRRDLNLRLTEMIQKEIEQRTPYKVVGTPEGADSTLEGTVSFADKTLLLETPNNLPRDVLASLLVTVRWTDNSSGQVVKERSMPPVPVNENTPFFPELGETSSLGFDKAMYKLARDVVNMMEEPW